MIADIVIAVVLILSAFIGWKRGFVKSVSKLCCWIIAIVVAKILNPYVSKFVKQSVIGEFIYKKFEETSHSLITDELPSFLQQAGETTANGLADTVTGVISVLIIIVITYFIANFIVGAINLVAKAPLISAVNGFLGIVSGVFTGVLIVYLIMAIISVCDVHEAQSWFDQSVVAYTMYRHNIFMDLIF